MKVITICIPLYNEQESIKELYQQLTSTFSLIPEYAFEILFINDGSHDQSLTIIQQLQEHDDRVAYVDLSRNYGKEIAMLAGFDHAIGDAVITMDADLQHPPQLIPNLIKEWEKGYQDVYGKRVVRSGESFFKKCSSKLYYKILTYFSKLPVLENVGDFRLLDRKCVNGIIQLRESERYTKGLYMWVGYKKKAIEFEAPERFAGETKWRLTNLLKLAMDGIVSNSVKPLRFSLVGGVVIALGAFIYMIYTIVKTLLFKNPVPGYPTLVVLILFLSGVQLIVLGIMGEYIGRIFLESKRRPPYLIQDYRKGSSSREASYKILPKKSL
ncbi:glycosyltransferase family 2 protein [Vagococcus lutrae]|uniref:glycosyltransferase family 2 protein n=1 Tax=Vagococcus lutrae TaxID=81947 RepID=UPI00200D7F5A|nr:glycosyltransferase family 2 protein [Vagococcus lutrae]UQF70275.1 glycosyltransferase family 2 protein [Vagococcus lutrae]